MKAMVFAAGLGTRLRPLTNDIPKALVKIGDKPLLQIVIEQLKSYGITEIVINVHYLAQKIEEFLKTHNNFGISIHISDESEELLETGGGLLKAKDFFIDDNAPFLVCNADIFTNINIQEFLNQHKKNNALATLAVRQRTSSRYLLFDDEHILFGWENAKTEKFIIPRTSARKYTTNEFGEQVLVEHPLHEFAFSGYHIIEPEIFNHVSRTGIFSMTDWYLDLCKNHVIKNYIHNDDIWIDIGTIEKVEAATQIYMSNNSL